MKLFEDMEVEFFNNEKKDQHRKLKQIKFDALSDKIREEAEAGASEDDLEPLYFVLGSWLHSLN